MDKFRDWPLLHEMPDGWKIDKTCGSPLAGYTFITNGKSVLRGGKRALLFIGKQKQIISKVDDCVDNVGITHGNKEIKSKKDFAIDASCARTVNELARESFKLKILNDILCDLTICKIEGWCKLDYLNEIRELINNLCADVVVSKLKKSEAAVPEGFKVVPVEPTTEQYGGLARDIIQWMRFTPSSDQHSQSLIEWLKNMGNEIPIWLMSENEINHLSKHVLSKGTMAAIIYKAMIEAAPDGDK